MDSGGRRRSLDSSGISIIVASVSRRVPATETAFSRATWATLAVSIMPASIRLTYCLRAASKTSSLSPAGHHDAAVGDGIFRDLPRGYSMVINSVRRSI